VSKNQSQNLPAEYEGNQGLDTSQNPTIATRIGFRFDHVRMGNALLHERYWDY
jgi:hypothetical protein